MALTFCGKKSEVGVSVSYGHISSLFLYCVDWNKNLEHVMNLLIVLAIY